MTEQLPEFLNTDPRLPRPPARRPNCRFMERLVSWIVRPIEFPGKWPVIKPPSERYNKEVQFESQRPHDE
jgi:hypothetical protein